MLLKGRPIGNVDQGPAGNAVARQAAKVQTEAVAASIVAAAPGPDASLTTALKSVAAPLSGGTAPAVAAFAGDSGPR